MSERDALVVDVGATTIKSARFGEGGVMRGVRAKRRTPYPCAPDRLVRIIAEMAKSQPTSALAVGFPGEVSDGTVIDAANLRRSGGPGTAVDPALVVAWSGFDLCGALAAASGVRAVVENDASLAARGCAIGDGVELTVTLGSGCGLALVRDGQLVAVRDIGAEPLEGNATYDEVLGERGRRRNESGWLVHVVSAVSALAHEFGATSIHLCGGNARRISRHSFGAMSDQVIIERGDPALLGGYRACYP